MSGNSIPYHLAIIMDGNNRWAKARKKFGIAGHQEGVERVREILEAAIASDVKVLTLYAFSSENWQRPAAEVKGLMSLLQRYLEKEAKLLAERNVRLQLIGSRERFSKKLNAVMDEAERLTSGGEYQLNIAVDYGGRWDIVEAAKKLAADVKANKLAVEDITEELFTSACQLSDIAPPDLLIRTGGQQRISNYLLWQCAYTEFYFTPELWPDFNGESLKQALSDYTGRQRRFGKTSEQIAAQGS